MEVLTALVERSRSLEAFRVASSVLVSSCNGAKGLEFDKVLLLTDKFNFRVENPSEDERRLFYVAMTRAREELVLAGRRDAYVVREAGVDVQWMNKMQYLDLTPGSVYLGHPATKNEQATIKALHEGDLLQVKANNAGDRWLIQTSQGRTIGGFSNVTVKDLKRKESSLAISSFGKEK